jgi:hypothetical protein
MKHVDCFLLEGDLVPSLSEIRPEDTAGSRLALTAPWPSGGIPRGCDAMDSGIPIRLGGTVSDVLGDLLLNQAYLGG